MKSQKDFFSGVMFLVCGLAFAIGARNYTFGTGARMGPGYFPMMLGIILAGLGVLIMIQSFLKRVEGGEKIGKWAWRPLAFIIGGNLLFGVLLGGLPKFGIPAMGMMVAIYGLTIVVSMAGERFNWKEVLTLATVLAILSYCAFILLLKLQFPVWPSFLTR